MGKRITGLVVGKEFLPPSGSSALDWCYLTVDMTDESRVSVRLSRNQVPKANVGDIVRLRRPARPTAPVRRIQRLGSDPRLLPPTD